jgi:tyrosine-protein phosphatase SIW14
MKTNRFRAGVLGYARFGHRRLARASTVAWICILIASPICLTAQAPRPEAGTPSSETKHAVGTRLKLRGVANFGEVSPTLYRGAQPTKEGFANLHRLGVNIVVDLRGSRASERALVNGLGMEYVAIPWHCYDPRDEHFAQFLKLLRDNPGKKVFVHCRLGDDRTGMEIAAYRMAEQGWTAEEARKEMEVFGVNWFHRTICPRLGPYEEAFPERFKSSPAFRDLRLDKDVHPPQP